MWTRQPQHTKPHHWVAETADALAEDFSATLWGDAIDATAADLESCGYWLERPCLADCLAFPPFVRGWCGGGSAGVALFQLPDLAKAHRLQAATNAGLRMLYEPIARFMQHALELPIVDFSVGHHNFKFRPAADERGVAVRPFDEWRSVLEAHFVRLVGGSGFGVGVRSRQDDGSLHVVSGAFLDWDKHRAQREMAAAFAEHFACLHRELDRAACERLGASEAAKVNVSVNPPTMQLHVANSRDAQGIVEFFGCNAVLCDADYCVWSECGRTVLDAAVQCVQRLGWFKQTLTQARLPRGLVNAELREAALENHQQQDGCLLPLQRMPLDVMMKKEAAITLPLLIDDDGDNMCALPVLASSPCHLRCVSPVFSRAPGMVSSTIVLRNGSSVRGWRHDPYGH